MMVAETSLVKKNHQIPRITNQKIAQKLIEKTSMTDIAHQLSISTLTVIRKLNDFHFEHDFSRLPKIMSWVVEQSGEWLFQSGDEDEFHCARFWQTQYHHCSWRQNTNYHSKSLSALR